MGVQLELSLLGENPTPGKNQLAVIKCLTGLNAKLEFPCRDGTQHGRCAGCLVQLSMTTKSSWTHAAN